jgi:hypothetical protein
MEDTLKPMYLSARYNQAISITVTQKDDLNVPIIYYSGSQDIYVKLSINKFVKTSDNGVSQVLQDSVGVKNIKLDRQSDLNGLFVFGTILDKTQLSQLGTYTGTIIVKQKYAQTTDPNDTNAIIDVVPVNITVEPNPLYLQTEFLQPDGVNRYTMADILTTLYNHLYISPRYATVDQNGHLVVRYSQKRGDDRVFIFRSSENSYLPEGSTITVASKQTGKPVGMYFRYPLYKTNHLGQDIVTLEQITKDGQPASYSVISNLPIGEYICYAEYAGAEGLKQTPYKYFTIN